MARVPSGILVWLGVSLILLASGALAFLGAKDDAPTIDEFRHITAGYSYVIKGDYRLNPEHPPLVKDLAGAALLPLAPNFPDEHPAWTEEINGQWELGRVFLYESGNDPDTIVTAARIPMILLFLLLALVVFLWTRALKDTGAAFIALALLALSPTLLAHGSLVTTDVASALGVTAATFAFLRFLSSPTILRTLLAGGALGLALLFKFSTLILAPFFLGLVVLYVLSTRERASLARYLSRGALAVMLALGVVLGTYSVHLLGYPQELQEQHASVFFSAVLPSAPEFLTSFEENSMLARSASHYIAGVLLSSARVLGEENVTYFLGEMRQGSWYYFPLLYLFKMPLALHALLLLVLGFALLSFRKGKRVDVDSWVQNHFSEVSFLVFLLLYGTVALDSSLNIGIRHILPVLPFLYILIAIGAREALGTGRAWKAAALGGLGAWYVGTSLLAFPHYLSYYNALAGGSENGYRVAVDSNYDWGQDLKRLGTWVKEERIGRIYVDYFGGGSPRYYLGDAYVPWNGSSFWLPERPEEFPSGNYLAVSATFLQSTWSEERTYETREYAWLEGRIPVARAGNSIFIYYIE